MTKYFETKISAENQGQADTILNSLLSKKLVTGGQFLHGPARFLWKNDIVDLEYVTIISFTSEENKDAIIEDVRAASKEDVPMVTFVEIDFLNEELSEYIDRALA